MFERGFTFSYGASKNFIKCHFDDHTTGKSTISNNNLIRCRPVFDFVFLLCFFLFLDLVRSICFLFCSVSYSLSKLTCTDETSEGETTDGWEEDEDEEAEPEVRYLD